MCDGIGRDLVTKASAATVNEDAHLVLLVNAHLGRSSAIEDLLYNLNLRIVIACTEGSLSFSRYAMYRYKPSEGGERTS